MEILNDFLDMIYPRVCPGCGRKSDSTANWCDPCQRKFWNPRLLNSSVTHSLHGCYTLCNYDEGIRKCIIQLKYNGKSELKRVFPELLEKFPWWDRLEKYTLVIPIPLSRSHSKERGYNQTDIIFEEWAGKSGKIYYPQGLVRIRNTETQSLLSKEERYMNMRGVFHINRGIDVRGKYILLVDDVYTTGATMESAAGELKRAGAEDVIGITLASGAI